MTPGNPVSELSDYDLRHLGAHLAAANAAAELDRLLALDWETADQPLPPSRRTSWRRAPPPSSRAQNAWYDAKESIGDADGYQLDVQLAWRMKTQTATGLSPPAGDLGKVAGEVRYALIAASISSLGGDLPGSLLRALVDQCVWTESHALTYARAAHGPTREKALTALVPALSPHARAAVVAELLPPTGRERRETLVVLSPYLNEDQIHRAIDEARTYSDVYQKSLAIKALVTRLGELGHVNDALNAAQREIPHEMVAGEAIADLAPQLNEAQVRESLQIVRAWEPIYSGQMAMAGLYPRLAELGHVREALDAIPEIDAPYQRAKTVAGLARALSTDEFAEASALLPADDELRAGALVALAAEADVDIRKALVDDAFASIAAIKWAHAQANTLERLAPELIALRPEATLEIALRINDHDERIRALGALVQYLPQKECDRARLAALESAQHSDALKPGIDLAAFARLAPVEAFALAESRGGSALAEVAPHLPADLLVRALDLCRRVDDHDPRNQALAAFAAELAALGESTGLDALAAVERADWRAQLLSNISTRIPEELVPAAFKMLYRLRGHDLEDPANALAARLSEEQRLRLLEATAKRDYDWAYATVVSAFVDKLTPNGVTRAFEIALTRKDEVWQAWAFAALAPRLEIAQLEKILDLIPSSPKLAFQRDMLRCAVAAQLVRVGRQRDGLDLAALVVEPRWRSEAISDMAPHLDRILDAVELTSAIADPGLRAAALSALAAAAQGPERDQLIEAALTVANQIKDQQTRAEALARVAKHLDEVKVEALAAIRETRALRLIVELTPLTGKALKTAVTLARRMENRGYEGYAGRDPGRSLAWAIVVFAAQEPTADLVTEAMEAIADYDFSFTRDEPLTNFFRKVATLPGTDTGAAWSATLPRLALRGRAALLFDLKAAAPLLGTLGGVIGLHGATAALRDVGRWWP